MLYNGAQMVRGALHKCVFRESSILKIPNILIYIEISRWPTFCMLFYGAVAPQ